MYRIKMKVVPHQRKTGMFYRVTPLPESYEGTNNDKYSRSMCANWFKKIFGVEPPTKTSFFIMQVEEVK